MSSREKSRFTGDNSQFDKPLDSFCGDSTFFKQATKIPFSIEMELQ